MRESPSPKAAFRTWSTSSSRRRDRMKVWCALGRSSCSSWPGSRAAGTAPWGVRTRRPCPSASRAASPTIMRSPRRSPRAIVTTTRRSRLGTTRASSRTTFGPRCFVDSMRSTSCRSTTSISPSATTRGRSSWTSASTSRIARTSRSTTSSFGSTRTRRRGASSRRRCCAGIACRLHAPCRPRGATSSSCTRRSRSRPARAFASCSTWRGCCLSSTRVS